jgi:hypothetical protein
MIKEDIHLHNSLLSSLIPSTLRAFVDAGSGCGFLGPPRPGAVKFLCSEVAVARFLSGSTAVDVSCLVSVFFCCFGLAVYWCLGGSSCLRLLRLMG